MDWNALAAQTLDAIKSVGTLVTIKRKSAVNFDAGSGTFAKDSSTSAVGRGLIKYPKPSGFEDGKTVRMCDVMVLLAASGLTLTPQAGDFVTAGTETSLQVLDVQPLSPAGVPLLYRVYCKR